MSARWLIRNLVDIATITASPALLASLPESYLQKMARSLTARTTSLATQDIKLSWPDTRTFTMVGETFTNFTTAAQRQVIIYPNSDYTGTPTYNPGAQNCWAYTGLSSHFSALDAEARIRKNGAVYFPAVTGKSMIVRYTDPANPDGFMDISRLFAGEYFEFAYDFPMAPGAMTPRTQSNSQELGDASDAVSVGENAFDLPLAHSFMQHSDWPHVMAAADYLGEHRDFFFSLFAGDGTFQEMYHQGRFRLAKPSASERHEWKMQRGDFMMRGQ